MVALVALVAGCGGREETKDLTAPTQETEIIEETTAPRETTEVTTGFEFSVGRSPMDEESPEDVLALQYEYINGGDFEEAYLLFAEQSRREVSLAQYTAFFEDNTPYSVTDYSFSPAEIQDNSASVDVAFTVTSASGVERLERTQEFVRESGDWRVVMRPEQVAVFTATQDEEEVDAELDQPTVECRAFTQSEFVNATPERKAFIRECDQAIIRSQQGSTSKGYPTPQGDPEDEAKTNALTPAGKILSDGDVDCSDFASPAEAQSYLLPGDPYGLDADRDGTACDES